MGQRLAWLLLREAPPLRVAERLREGLSAFALRAGKPGLYHETITCAYVFIINERMRRMGRGRESGSAASFDDFSAANPDLFRARPSVLAAYYSDGALASDLARSTFLMPDLTTRSFRASGDGERGAGIGPELAYEAGGAHHEGRTDDQVGEGHEQRHQTEQAEAEHLRAPVSMPAALGREVEPPA